MKHVYYKLDENKKVVPCTVEEWARRFDQDDRVVGRTTIGSILVSTVFTGMDYDFSGEGPPILWETMIFRLERQLSDCDRCSGTWEDAEAMHARMVAKLISNTTPNISIEHGEAEAHILEHILQKQVRRRRKMSFT